MVVIRGDCAHCQTRGVGFNVWRGGPEGTGYRERWDFLAVCGRCQRGSLVSIECPGTENPLDLPDELIERIFDGGAHEILPTLGNVEIPAHIPRNIAKFFKQARQSLEIGAWDAAGAMCRKVLEASLKYKFPDHPANLKLVARIRKAEEEGNLTRDLAGWADEIRHFGNDATHEDDPFSEDEAKKVDLFTEMMLIYLFTLPARLSLARAARKNESGLDDIPF